MKRIILNLFVSLLVCFSLSAENGSEEKEMQKILKNITGATDFKVEEPLQNGIQVSVADFGASPSASGIENVHAFEKAINKVKEIGATTLNIPFGVYYLNDERTDQILLNQIQDLLIEGNNSELIFGEHNKAVNGSFIRISNSNRIKIQHLKLDWNWNEYPLFVIGKIISLNKEKLEVEFEINHFDLPEKIKFGGGRPWDMKIDNRDAETGFPFPQGYEGVAAIRKSGERRLVLTYKKPEHLDNAHIGQYGQIYLKPCMNANAINSRDNKNLIFDDLTIYSAPYIAVNTYGIENFQVINSHTIPRPGSNRRFSTYGGYETHSVKGNFKFENCVMDGIQDDHINVSNGYLGGGLKFVDKKTVKAGFLQKFQTDALVYKGAQMALYDKYYRKKNWSSKVKSFTWEQNTYPSRNSDGITICFEDPLPKDLREDDILWNTDMFKGNFIIRNNVFKNGLCHCLYVGLGNGTIENNQFSNFAYPTLIVNTVRRWSRWFIGNPIENVIIRNNVIKDNNTDRRDPATMFIGAGIDAEPSDYLPVPSKVVQNICVENNIIENSTWAAFATFSSKNIIVRNNKFINSNLKPSKKLFEGKGNAFVTNAENVFLVNNTIYNTRPTFERGLYIEDSTTRNIHVINKSPYLQDQIVVKKAANDCVDIYMKGSNKSSNRYIKYKLKHVVDLAKNTNLWRILCAYDVLRIGEYEFSDTYSEPVITQGEWECAIRQKKNGVLKKDFMGGFHGYEELKDATLWADGKEIDLSVSSDFFAKQIKFEQHATIYEHETKHPLVNHTKVYILEKGEISIDQKVEWIEPVEITNCYMAMLPIIRKMSDGTLITDHAKRKSDKNYFDVSEPNKNLDIEKKRTNVFEAEIYGEKSGIVASMKVTPSVVLPHSGFSVWIRPNGYNKFYFDYSGNYITKAGEIWENKSNYKIDIIK